MVYPHVTTLCPLDVAGAAQIDGVQYQQLLHCNLASQHNDKNTSPDRLAGLIESGWSEFSKMKVDGVCTPIVVVGDSGGF